MFNFFDKVLFAKFFIRQIPDHAANYSVTLVRFVSRPLSSLWWAQNHLWFGHSRFLMIINIAPHYSKYTTMGWGLLCEPQFLFQMNNALNFFYILNAFSEQTLPQLCVFRFHWYIMENGHAQDMNDMISHVWFFIILETSTAILINQYTYTNITGQHQKWQNLKSKWKDNISSDQTLVRSS